jgi:hypothetical protein
MGEEIGGCGSAVQQLAHGAPERLIRTVQNRLADPIGAAAHQ